MASWPSLGIRATFQGSWPPLHSLTMELKLTFTRLCLLEVVARGEGRPSGFEFYFLTDSGPPALLGGVDHGLICMSAECRSRAGCLGLNLGPAM